MLKSLLVLLRLLRSAWLFETTGAVLGCVALYLAWGVAAALGGASVALLLKAFELDGDG